MEIYQKKLQEETVYLEETIDLIKRELALETTALAGKKARLIALGKDMWENTVHFSNDFDRLPEINQYLAEVNNQACDYGNTLKRIEKYSKILGTPYFGRFDFSEEGSTEREKIYIGLCNVNDSKTHKIAVYDWRAPISSLFYRFEVGRASYDAPSCTISGDVWLKRQYKIINSRLKYFFDSTVNINDEILQEVLSRTSSAKMRNIVKTIQKEQDLIIRDTENELLIVQGVAGSGKTSVALHRIAFLLYEGMNSKVDANNITIISPNPILSRYISGVLPELGEENVDRTTFDEIAAGLIDGRMRAETRNEQFESLITSRGGEEEKIRRQGIELKGSREFAKILDRLIQLYERRLIAFEDVCFDGKTLFTRHQLKSHILNNKIGMPLAKRLQRLENKILEKVYPLRKIRLKRIEKVVENSDGHDMEVRSFSRLLSLKESKKFLGMLRKFTVVEYLDLYKLLFNKQELFNKLAGGLELPGDIEQAILRTKECLENGYLYFEDCAPVLYLKLKLEGADMFSGIRQVVIDEAQDYYPMQYEVFRLLFREARLTLLGDIHQAIEKDADMSIYDTAADIFNKQKTVKLSLNKSYRSSFEINTFNQKLLKGEQDFISFERHEAEPMVVYKEGPKQVDHAVENDIADYLERGYESIAVVGKTWEEAKSIFAGLKNSVHIKLVSANSKDAWKGAMVIPAYMMKGLEFDAVIIHGASRENYYSEFDRKLLYLACTRALHRLTLYYTGEKSPFL